MLADSSYKDDFSKMIEILLDYSDRRADSSRKVVPSASFRREPLGELSKEDSISAAVVVEAWLCESLRSALRSSSAKHCIAALPELLIAV